MWISNHKKTYLNQNHVYLLNQLEVAVVAFSYKMKFQFNSSPFSIIFFVSSSSNETSLFCQSIVWWDYEVVSNVFSLLTNEWIVRTVLRLDHKLSCFVHDYKKGSCRFNFYRLFVKKRNLKYPTRWWNGFFCMVRNRHLFNFILMIDDILNSSASAIWFFFRVNRDWSCQEIRDHPLLPLLKNSPFFKFSFWLT